MSAKQQKPTDENRLIQEEKDKLIETLNAENEKLAAENVKLLAEVERLSVELTGECWVELSARESIRSSELRRLARGNPHSPEVNLSNQNKMHQWSLPSLFVNGIEVQHPLWSYQELLATLRSGGPLDKPKELGTYKPAGANPNAPINLCIPPHLQGIPTTPP